MSKIAGGAAAGAVGGGGAMLAIFELANFKELFNANNAPIGMLDALAIFSCLALFSIFAYAHAVQSPPDNAEKVAKLQLIATCIFGLVVITAVVVFGLVTIRPSPAPAKASTLNATFGDYKTVANFPIDAGDERVTLLSPGLSDGAPLPFDRDGFRAITMNGDKNITIDVKGLVDLENAFNRMKEQRNGLMKQRQALAVYCKGQAAVARLSQECLNVMDSIAVVPDPEGKSP